MTSPRAGTVAGGIAITMIASAVGCSLIDLDPLTSGDGTTLGAGGATGSSVASSGESVESSAATNSTVATTATATSVSTDASTTTASGSSSAGVPVLQDCVLLLHMDEAVWVDDDDVIDASGQANHGTPKNGATPGMGRYGNGALFTGVETIVVPNTASLQATDQLTYMAWVRPTALDGTRGIIAKRITFDQQVAFTLFLFNNAALGGTTWTADVETTRFNANVLTPLDEWHHVAIVYDGARPATERSRIFVDGNLSGVGSGPTTLSPNTVDLTIGALPSVATPPTAFFMGTIDEVAVWRRALDPDEILAIATANAPL